MSVILKNKTRMNIKELKLKLEALNKSESIIKLRTKGYGDEEWVLNGDDVHIRHVLKRKGLFSKIWVYYDENERGGRSHYNTFGSEDDACNFVYNYALNYWSKESEEESRRFEFTNQESMRAHDCMPKTFEQLESMLKELNIPEELFSLNNPLSPTSYYIEKLRSPHSLFYQPAWLLYEKDSHGYIRNGRIFCFEDYVCHTVFLYAKWAMHKNGLYLSDISKK